MAAMDEFREEREAIKHGTWKQKLEYFWDYYKIHTLVVVAVLVFVVSMIYNHITATEPALDGIFLNAYSQKDSASTFTLMDDFAKAQKIDLDEYHIDSQQLAHVSQQEQQENANIDASIASSANTSLQVIMTKTSAEVLDFIVGPHASAQEFAYGEYFIDLTEILSEEQYKQYEPYFLYIDMAVLKQIREANNNLDSDIEVSIPKSTSPEDLKEPIPVLIDLTQCQKLMDAYGYEPKNLAIGVIANSTHKEMALNFIDFLMTE